MTSKQGSQPDANLVSAIERKLGSLVGKSSGYLESLPISVQNRVKALKHLHGKHIDHQKEYNRELLELEKKYSALYQPLYERRSQLVSGSAEPKEEELVEESTEEGKEATETSKEEGADIKGIPEFWLQTLVHHPDFGSMISDRDEDALKHLIDIKVIPVQDSPHSFTLEFQFTENEFFDDTVLRKTYVLKESPDDAEVLFDHVDASEIKWKAGKNLTVKKVTKQPKGKGRRGRGGKSGGGAPITVEEPCSSFFNFFNPAESFKIYSQEEMLDEEDVDGEEAYQEFLEADYEMGLELKEKIIPHAVTYFTGEAAVDLPFDFDEDDEDDEEESDEDGSAQPKANVAQADQPECKQQ